MHGEDLFINDCSYRQAIEAIGESLPQFNVVSTLTLVIEAVDTVDGSTFMVAAQDEKVFRILDLVGEEQANGLQ